MATSPKFFKPFDCKRMYATTPERLEDIKFYKSKRWRDKRAHILRLEPLCRDCSKEGLVTPAQHVHHIIERKERPDLAFEDSNLEPTCIQHHNAKRKAKLSRNGDHG